MFAVLAALKAHPGLSQRQLHARTGVSLGKVNGCVQALLARGWIQEGRLTPQGEAVLAPYRVDNAVIMAAGMSSRFAPLSYEKPKGLLMVKGEVLIERQIRQLQEAGIQDITVVVGYMKEKFFYLREKFGVTLVVNEDYYRYNNPSTLIQVADKLKNTYICSSDNYFVDNVFEPYVFEAYYAAVFFPGVCSEWGLCCNRGGRITAIDHQPRDQWCMLGHVYFSQAFSQAFVPILRAEYAREETRHALWEHILEQHLSQLPMCIRKYDADKVLEFDSLEELQRFDPKYLENTDSRIFRNICGLLGCRESEIRDITVLKQGMTNLSFRFSCRGKDYVYRHPGMGTDQYISRRSEAFSMGVASRLGLDKTYIYVDPKEGWKLSGYIRDAKNLDYHDEAQVRQALGMMRTLHDAAVISDYDFGLWEHTAALIEKISAGRKNFADFDSLQAAMVRLYTCTRQDDVRRVLCHCDCYDPNFLVEPSGEMTLIDWEYSGNDDPAADLGTFICCSDYTDEESLHVLELYYGRPLTPQETRHTLAYIALAAYYWFIWAIYQESMGSTVGAYLLLWYEFAKRFGARAAALYHCQFEEEES